MARYIPSDETARWVASDWLRARLTTQLTQGNVTVSFGQMTDDGTVAVYLRADANAFDFAAYNEVPQIDGIAWIEDTSPPEARYEFADRLQPYDFLHQHANLR